MTSNKQLTKRIFTVSSFHFFFFLLFLCHSCTKRIFHIIKTWWLRSSLANKTTTAICEEVWFYYLAVKKKETRNRYFQLHHMNFIWTLKFRSITLCVCIHNYNNCSRIISFDMLSMFSTYIQIHSFQFLTFSLHIFFSLPSCWYNNTSKNRSTLMNLCSDANKNSFLHILAHRDRKIHIRCTYRVNGFLHIFVQQFGHKNWISVSYEWDENV